MWGPLVGLCLLLCSCDTVFQLERPDAPTTPDAPIVPTVPLIIDPTGDADSDGQPNATDLCPAIENSVLGANADEDGDGVGNKCDPAPQIPGDCLMLFDAFQGASPLSSHWRHEGAPIAKSPGQLIIPPGPETVVYLDVELALTSVTVGGYVESDGPRDRHAIQLLFDHSRVNGVTGQACSVESNSQGSQPSKVAVVDVADGADMELNASPLDDTPVGAGTTVELGWNDRHGTTGDFYVGRCRAELADQSQGTPDVMTDVIAVPPPGRVFGLRTLSVGFNLYGIIGYGRNCVTP